MLKQRLDVLMFKDEGPLKPMNISPARVRVPLKEHLGSPAQSVVKEGDRVKRFDLIGKSSSTISSNVHASIDGVVRKITEADITIERA